MVTLGGRSAKIYILEKITPKKTNVSRDETIALVVSQRVELCKTGSF